MTALSFVLGVVLVALGAFWLAQRLGFVQGTFMTGIALWTWVGSGVVVAGTVLTAFSITRRLAAVKTRS